MVIEEKLYKYFKVPPFKLSTCQYYNEYNFGIYSGDDVCEHTDTETFKCEDCEKSKLTDTWYPEITDDIIARLLWLVPIQGEMPIPWEDLKEKVINNVIENCPKDKYNIIQEILNAHKVEMSRW